MTALAKDPGQRFQKAEAFRKALENVRGRESAAQAATVPVRPVASALPTEYIPVSSPLSRVPASKSHRSLWMALGALACVGVLAAGISVVPHFWKAQAANPSSGVIPQSGIPVHDSREAKQPASGSAAGSMSNGTVQDVTPAVPHASATASNQTDNSDQPVSSKREQVSRRNRSNGAREAASGPANAAAARAA